MERERERAMNIWEPLKVGKRLFACTNSFFFWSLRKSALWHFQPVLIDFAWFRWTNAQHLSNGTSRRFFLVLLFMQISDINGALMHTTDTKLAFFFFWFVSPTPLRLSFKGDR